MTGSYEETVEFCMQEGFDDPDVVRLRLSGELDLAVAKIFGDRLRTLRNDGYAVRLDLAELDFIDSSGLLVLIVAMSEARCNGGRLAIDPEITEPVRRAIEVAGLRSSLWPDDG